MGSSEACLGWAPGPLNAEKISINPRNGGQSELEGTLKEKVIHMY